MVAFPRMAGRWCAAAVARATRVGEHRPVIGGRWGYVDRSGQEVVPVRLSRSAALELLRERPTKERP